ncbi:Hypothetical predicted protein [Olea europaea subsp. europaea]|uniref:Uncharacterized protein n=1 Tax=Olea europaea subsp. europaea TaxID=158383 RepID=A0A8S0RSV8_OLEEU|nr:Hypothetical predicted protein [Olea europaea subsp. europaea]
MQRMIQTSIIQTMTYRLVKSLITVASNKERIEVLEARLSRVRGRIQQMECGEANKLNQLEETINRLSEAMLSVRREAEEEKLKKRGETEEEKLKKPAPRRWSGRLECRQNVGA